MKQFRGKRIDNGEWCTGYYCVMDGTHYIIAAPSGIVQKSGFASMHGFCEVDPSTVGQSTGLKDKNGTEIFEGDVIKFSTNGKDFQTAIIEWQELPCMAGFSTDISANGHMHWEIIGTIHTGGE